jgi:hypothetical protein
MVVTHTQTARTQAATRSQRGAPLVQDEQRRGDREHRMAAREAVRLAVHRGDPTHEMLAPFRAREIGPVNAHRERDEPREHHDARERLGPKDEPQFWPGQLNTRGRIGAAYPPNTQVIALQGSMTPGNNPLGPPK